MQVDKLLWELFSLLCQGTIAGLIVLAVSAKLQSRRERVLLQKYALLISTEIKDHIISIKRLDSHFFFPLHEKTNLLPTTMWDNHRHNITALSLEELEEMASYYQSVKAVNDLLIKYSGKAIPQDCAESFHSTLQMATLTYHFISCYWDKENVQLHRKSLKEIQKHLC